MGRTGSATRLIALSSLLLVAGVTGCRDGAEAAGNIARTTGDAPVPESDLTPVSGWTGRYTYDYDGGRTAGGSTEIVSYTLTIGPSTCRLDASGFQTDETILCTTRSGAGKVDVLFKSYGDGGTTDRYGNPVYSVGDPLFALEQAGGRLLTRWKGYALPDDKPHPPGLFFRRQHPST